MTIPPVAVVSLEVLTPLNVSPGFRDVAVLQAKVTAMISDTLARLAIEGQSVDVATSKPLPVGTTLTLKADWKDGQLRLVSQGEVKPPPSPGSARPAAPVTPHILSTLAGPVNTALAKIQSMALDAILAGAGAADKAVPQNAAAAQERPGAPTQQSAEAAQRAQGAASLASALNPNGPPASEASGRRIAAADLTETARAHHTSDASGGTGRTAERAVTFLVEVPVYFPGSNAPLLLQVTRDGEPESQAGEETRAPSWMVRFSSETASLGRIDAAISLIDGHIGVQIWAERSETADRFQQSSPQLRDALVASDLQLDTVRIAAGHPQAEH